MYFTRLMASSFSWAGGHHGPLASFSSHGLMTRAPHRVDTRGRGSPYCHLFSSFQTIASWLHFLRMGW